MEDSKRPVDIASFSTEMGAKLCAGMLHSDGIQAAVFGSGVSFTGMVQDCRDWRLMVPADEAERARGILLDAREKFTEKHGLRECPGCGYSLDGLTAPERCPECGRELAEDREKARMPEFVLRDVDPKGAHRLWGIVLAILAVCGAVGLASVFFMSD